MQITVFNKGLFKLMIIINFYILQLLSRGAEEMSHEIIHLLTKFWTVSLLNKIWKLIIVHWHPLVLKSIFNCLLSITERIFLYNLLFLVYTTIETISVFIKITVQNNVKMHFKAQFIGNNFKKNTVIFRDFNFLGGIIQDTYICEFLRWFHFVHSAFYIRYFGLPTVRPSNVPHKKTYCLLLTVISQCLSTV